MISVSTTSHQHLMMGLEVVTEMLDATTLLPQMIAQYDFITRS